jgi:hypothetical protein
MKRDMDLIRELLLRLEARPMELGDAAVITPEDPALAVAGFNIAQINHHLDLIHQAGFIDDGGHPEAGPMFGFVFLGITWAGHDFLDSVRDPVIWAKTKKGATDAGGFTLDLLKDLAKGYLKKQIEEKTGVALDL